MEMWKPILVDFKNKTVNAPMTQIGHFPGNGCLHLVDTKHTHERHV